MTTLLVSVDDAIIDLHGELLALSSLRMDPREHNKLMCDVVDALAKSPTRGLIGTVLRPVLDCNDDDLEFFSNTIAVRTIHRVVMRLGLSGGYLKEIREDGRLAFEV